MELGDLQKALSASHEYVMLLNALLCCFVLIRDCKWQLNFYCLSSIHKDWISLIAAFWLPAYYALEAGPTTAFCANMYLSACKYTVHHILTVSLFGLMFTNDLLTGPSYLVQAAHGLMNFAYYYNPLVTYLCCKWYIATTVYCSVHIAYHMLVVGTATRVRVVLAVALLHLAALGVNNVYTDELVEICELEESGDLERSVKIWSAHIVALALFVYYVRRYTRLVPALPLHVDEGKFY